MEPAAEKARGTEGDDDALSRMVSKRTEDNAQAKMWQYNVIAWRSCEDFAERLQASDPDRFQYHKTIWEKFDDSKMDHIIVGGFRPKNLISRSHVLFLASFDDNDAIMSQLHALTMLCESFIKTLTIYIPYFPVATMERVVLEGEVATANTLSRVLSALPRIGSPARVMFYDLHTLQNRFYFHTGAIATMHSGIPLIRDAMGKCTPKITAVAFPDEGAQKRFGKMFPGMPSILCGKTRIGDTRQVVVQDGDPSVRLFPSIEHTHGLSPNVVPSHLAAVPTNNCRCMYRHLVWHQGQHVLIVDDVVKTGGTLVTCAVTMKSAGALSISAFCTHCGFPQGAAQRFCKGGDRDVFAQFWLTNSNPIPVQQVEKLDRSISPFAILDLMPLVKQDLGEW